MIMNYTTNEITQNTTPTTHKQSSTPTKTKAQKIQKKIRKESTCLNSTSTKGTPKQQQQQQQLPKNKQVISSLISPSQSDKTVFLSSSICQNTLKEQNLKKSASCSGVTNTTSSGSEYFGNTLNSQQQQIQKPNLYQGSEKRKGQTKISPRSQTSSLTSEISSFELYSYNEYIASSTSSTNQGVNHQASHSIPQSHKINPKDAQTIQNKSIQFSPNISSPKETLYYQPNTQNPIDPISNTYSPKYGSYCNSNIDGQYSQLHSQKNNLNNIISQNLNNSYNNGYQTSPNMKQNYNYNISNEQGNLSTYSNLAAKLLNWNVLPIEIQRATSEFNGRIEEVQKNFDNIVPMIEMPYNRKDAYYKVREAQQLQEQQVFQLTNVKNGTTLKEAFDNLIKQLQRKNNGIGSSEENVKPIKDISSNQGVQQQSQGKNCSAKQKKTSKKSNKQEKDCSSKSNSLQNQINGSNYSSVQQNNSNGQINNTIQNENNIQFNNSLNFNSNSYNYLPDDSEMQNKDIENHVSTSFQHGNQQSHGGHNMNTEFNENPVNNLHANQINHNQSTDMFGQNHNNKNSLMSPRKVVHSMQGYDEEVMSQQELMHNEGFINASLRKYGQVCITTFCAIYTLFNTQSEQSNIQIQKKNAELWNNVIFKKNAQLEH